ncbi:hypothetical protein L218DRAFT_949773 [Marasmius fiardii PR-910]|nr:hypothetical protein L218DRAFT_949773 [Marasmius fiardii PR-910]
MSPPILPISCNMHNNLSITPKSLLEPVFSYIWNIIQILFIGNTIMVLLYGVYLVLYIQCIQILFKQKQKRYHLYSITISILFTLATLSIGFNIAVDILIIKYLVFEFGAGDFPNLPCSRTVASLVALIDFFTIIGNIVTDIILLCVGCGNSQDVIFISVSYGDAIGFGKGVLG